jgi:acetoin utilization protein AcuC
LGVSGSVLLLWDEELMRYDLGGTHPMHPGRLELTMALARDLSILARSSLSIAAPEPATDEILALVHDPAYIAVVRGAPLLPPSSPAAQWMQRVPCVQVRWFTP